MRNDSERNSDNFKNLYFRHFFEQVCKVNVSDSGRNIAESVEKKTTGIVLLILQIVKIYIQKINSKDA